MYWMGNVSILIITELHLEVYFFWQRFNILILFQSLLSRNYISKHIKQGLWDDNGFCFNPYYHGTTSRSVPFHHLSFRRDEFQSLLSRNYISKFTCRRRSVRGFSVSILIITELHLEVGSLTITFVAFFLFQSLLSRNYISKSVLVWLIGLANGSFNPYYHGTTSRSDTFKDANGRGIQVSILIITELHLEVKIQIT